MPDPTVKRPKSKLAALKRALRPVVAKGLPPSLAKFFAKGDGLTTTYRVGSKRESATLVGLEAMFGGMRAGAFVPHRPIKNREDFERALLEGPPEFEDVFYSASDDVDGRASRDRINLLLRLKLLAHCEGEPAALGIDLGGRSTLYFVDRAYDAWPLALDFDTFVEHFVEFGTRRWYFAFLDRKAERGMNVDLRAEFERSMAPFSGPRVDALRARFPKKKAKKAAPAKPPAAAPEQEDDLPALWKKEAAEALKDKDKTLFFAWTAKKPGAWDAFATAVGEGQIPLAAVWAIEGGVEHLPPEKLVDLLLASRPPRHDALWQRVNQVLALVLQALDRRPQSLDAVAKRLDPMMSDVVEVARLVHGEQAAGTASKRIEKTIGSWHLSSLTDLRLAPTVGLDGKTLPYLQNAFERDRDVLLEFGARLVGRERAIALSAAGLRAWLAKKKWSPLHWPAVLVAGPELSFDEVRELLGLYLPAEALEVLVRQNGWPRQRVKQLADAPSPNASAPIGKTVAAVVGRM